MSTVGVLLSATAVLLVAPFTRPAMAQSTDGESRQAIVEQEQAAKSTALRPYVPGAFESAVIGSRTPC
jgi:hypothetical protein